MGKHRKRSKTTGALVFCLLLTIFSGVSRAEEPVYDLDIPAMNAAEALNRFAEQTGAIMLFPYDLASARQANAVTGRYTLLEGLDLLLQGTGLSGGLSDKRVVNISLAENEQRIAEEGSMRAQKVSLGRKITAFVASIFSVSAASGQDSDVGPGSLEEVIVTAQKREERLIDVPQAVSILSPDDLARSGIVQFRDYAHSAPGLNFVTRGAGMTSVSMRGVTLGNDLGPTVGIYVDEVPYGSSSSLSLGFSLAFDSALFDLERIEVLKGPQGTYYGASSMGGVIKYVSKAPSTESFSGKVQTGFGDTNSGGVSYNGAATINAPIVTDKLAVRATGFYSRDGGYIDNVARDEDDINRSNIYGGRADLLFTPTEALSIRLTGFLQIIDRDGTGTADYSLTGARPHGSLAQNRPTAEPFEQRFRLVSGTVVYDLNWAALTSITSYQTARTEFRADSTALFGSLAEALFGRSYSGVGQLFRGPTDKFMQELRLASEGGGKSLEWVIGGFYTRETTRLDQGALLFDLGGDLTPDDLFTLSAPSQFEEYAAFGTLTWHLSDKLNVSGGIRYADNREEVTQHGSGLLVGSRPTARSGENVATYLANARYHFSDHATLYLRYATGYRPGGPNYLVLDATTGLPVGPARFESDSLKSYEIGFKGETKDRRFRIDLAAFHLDWDDMILFAVRSGVGFRDNAPGGARVRGAEFSLTTRPTNTLTVSSAFAYLDPHLREANGDLGAAKGERLPGVPRVTAALNADYELPWGRSFQPRVGATLRYVDDRMASFDARPDQYRLPDYTTVDLRAGFALDRVNVQLYVRNLFDKRGQLSAYSSGAVAIPAILQPRTIGVVASTKF